MKKLKHLKKYKEYKESILIDLEYQELDDLMESMNIWHDSLISAISGEELDIFTELKLPVDGFENKLADFDHLSNNIEFINSLSSLGLKKSEVKNTEDFETFLNKPCKFMFIYRIEANELENPEYLLFQTWNESMNKWEPIRLYSVKDNVRKFYDKLTSKRIEIIDGEDKYIYFTTNGNEWELQNIDTENDTFKRIIRTEDLEKLVKEKKVKINIF